MDGDFLRLISVVKKGMLMHCGKENAIKSSEIVLKLKANGYNLNSAKLRAVIHHLRTKHKMLICGDNKGYYLAANAFESSHQIKSMKSRIREITEAAVSLELAHSKLFKQQSIFD